MTAAFCGDTDQNEAKPEDNDNATGLIYDYTRKTIGFGNLSNLANTPGLTYKTDTDLLRTYF